MIENIRKEIEHEEFDYQTLMDCLRGYARPRDKVSALLKKGSIIRIKKGLYIFGDLYRRRPYSREILANLIYGPSYISLDFALQHYGLIPECVEAVNSVTTGRSFRFVTPVGLFTYHKIPLAAFLKKNTRKQLIVIKASDDMVKTIPRGQILKVKLEVDTDPPPGFETQTRYLLQPLITKVRGRLCVFASVHRFRV